MVEESGNEVLEDLSALYDKTFQGFERGQIVKGTVIQLTSNEILLDIGYKTEGIIPRANLGRELKLGEEVEVCIVNLENKEGLVVLSKAKADQIKTWQEVVQAHQDQRPREGKVLRRVKGGFMVDIGLEAFLPASQASLYRLANPEKLLGQRIKVQIIDVDQDRKNIIISRKVLLKEERNLKRKEALTNLKEGDRVSGVIKNITDFGAFVDLGIIDGLIHINDISWGHVKHPSQALQVGDRVKAAVLSVDMEAERISLGLKQLKPDPWLDIDRRSSLGSVVDGEITAVTNFGAFMRLEEGVEGLIHVSQLAREYVENPSQAVSVGDQVKAKVTRIDFHNRRMALSIKKYLLEKEEEEELAQYKASEKEVKPRTDDNEQKIEERG
jgi:small subunit ribosomal protein S1